MKKLINLFGKNLSVLSVLMFVLAVVSGGATMAVAITDEGPDAKAGQTGAPDAGTARDDAGHAQSNSSTANTNLSADPAYPGANDRLAPGGGKVGQDLTGTQASATQIVKGGLAEDEWDNEIVKFRPWNTPLLSLVRKVSKTYKTDGYVRKHMRIGGETLEAKVLTAFGSTGSSNKPTSVTISKSGVQGSLRPFYKGKKIYCLGIPGYKKGSATVRQGTLTLVVIDTDKNFNTITVAALNGPAVNAGEAYATDELDCRFVPNVPVGTVLAAGTVAMSESQKLVTPENYQPRESEVYLQKKGFNIVFTEEFEKIQKKQPLKIADIKADTLVKYNIGAERDYWLSCKARWNTTNEDGSVEYTYSAEGILNQITNSIAIDGAFTLPLLTAITKLQFTEFSEHNTAYAFCGKNAMEKLLNIQLGTNERHIFEDVKQFDIDFKRYATTFGTIDFTWCQTLDMIGLEDCIVVLDLKGLVRYVKMAPQEETNDMSKGAGEIRDAKRILYKEADCVALRGYNSIIIGPSEKIYNIKSAANVADITMTDTIPTSAQRADGMKIVLTQNATDNVQSTAQSLLAGVVYEYDSTQDAGAKWVVYTGVSDAS